MRTITRKLEFDAGHRLVGHESKCSHLHGHRYVAEIECYAEELDSVGRVIDFSVIKSEIGGWIDHNWDHNMILNSSDPLLKVVPTPFTTKAPFLMEANPTVENMVELLGHVSSSLMRIHDIKVVSIRLYETPNCWADWKP